MTGWLLEEEEVYMAPSSTTSTVPPPMNKGCKIIERVDYTNKCGPGGGGLLKEDQSYKKIKCWTIV